ncbi:MAG: O-antigen ligase family protein [Firmicutes bacterium]|nr:O-antigen ligase family protein [Bacillota bacterium]
MPQASRSIEKFFFTFLIINPFLDIFTGAYIHVGFKILGERLTDLITPTLIVRMVVLLLFLVYIFSERHIKSILILLPIGLAWAMSVLGEFLFAGGFSLFTDMQYMAKFVYNIALILVLTLILQHSSWNREKLLGFFNWYISLTLLILALSIHVPYVLGLGYSTYADRFGYFGARGFFYSGNDITAVLMMLIPIALINYISLPSLTPGRRMRLSDLWPQDTPRRRHLFYLAAPAAALAALFSIATKTAFIAFGVTMLVVGIYYWRMSKNSGDKAPWQAFCRICIAFVAIFAFLSLFGLIKDLADILERFKKWSYEDPNFITLLGSGRIEKMIDTFAAWKAAGPFAWIFGIGRGTRRFVIEMDVCETFFYYGLLGTLAMLWLYIKLGVAVVKSFIGIGSGTQRINIESSILEVPYYYGIFGTLAMLRLYIKQGLKNFAPRRRDAYALALFISVGLAAAYSILAGHVLFSVTSGFYFAFMLIYSRLYFAKSKEEFKL